MRQGLQIGAKRLQIGAALGLQIGASIDYKSGQVEDYKSGQKDYKTGQGLQIGAKGLQIGAGITNRCSTPTLCINIIVQQSFKH